MKQEYLDILEIKDKNHINNINDVDWYCISRDKNLSEDFIREFKDYIDWDLICEHQVLSENFIEEFKDDIFWYIICEF